MHCLYCNKKKRWWQKGWSNEQIEAVRVWFCSSQHRSWYMGDKLEKSFKR